MAEIFGAVASGAGLISLSMQLLESSQKLKSFYNASKDAPQTLADLSFELKTMSMSLRQLAIHRQADISSDTLLDRCMMTCTHMTTKIEAAVDKMENLLRKSRGIGRIYSAFKEPEISKLLESLEHAKSSMLFAYMSYCQSWNLREASLRAAEAQAQNALLSSHESQLQSLNLVVQSGHAAILERIETTRPSSSSAPSDCTSPACHTREKMAPRSRDKRPSARTFRLALPRWFSHYVWEFAAHERDGAWNFSVRPVNVRPQGAFVFDIVRSGNVEAVKKLLMSGELSLSDHEDRMFGLRHASLLSVAVQAGRPELCEFLLHECPTYYSEPDLHRVLKSFIRTEINFLPITFDLDGVRGLNNAFYTLFLRYYGVSVDLYELIDKPTVKPRSDCWSPSELGVDIGSNLLLTDEALKEVIRSQTIPFHEWRPKDRFCAAVNARGWPAGAFVELIHAESDIELARWADSQGKTALQWAAEHFGYWMSCSRVPVSSRNDEARQREYAQLCTMLITKGADLTALDSEDRTPLVYFLQAMLTKYEFWSKADLSDAVVQWGQHIQDAGVSLNAYVVAENCLQSRLGGSVSNIRIDFEGHSWTWKLVITEALTLAIEVGISIQRSQWQYRPPPGAWRRGMYQLEKIAWSPEFYFEGDDYILWQHAQILEIDICPVLIHPYQPSLFRQNAADAWREWANGVQDDHGFVFKTLQRLPGMSKERVRGRRASSLPPPTIMLDGNLGSPNGHCFVSTLKAHAWISGPHKCPLDLTWKSAYRASNDHQASRRRCMIGRCSDGEPELLFSSHWEVKLLDDENNIEIARRFTDRFRPEWRHIVEENHRRRQRLAELGMSAM